MIRKAAPPAVKDKPTRQELRGPKKRVSPISESLQTPHPGGSKPVVPAAEPPKAPAATLPDSLVDYMKKNHPDIASDENLLDAIEQISEDAVKVVGRDLANSAAKLKVLYKQLFEEGERSGKFSKKDLEVLTRSFNQIVHNTLEAQRRHRKYEDSIETLTEELDEARQNYDRIKYDYEHLPLLETGLTYEDVEKAEEELLAVQRKLDVAVKKMQLSAERTTEAVNDYEEVLDHEVELLDEEDAALQEVKEKASTPAAEVTNQLNAATKEIIKTYLDAFSVSIGIHIPNDASVESELMDIMNQFQHAGTMVGGAAKLSRDPEVIAAVRALSAFLMLPGAGLKMATKANDDQPRTADWRDVLKSINPLAPKDVRRAHQQASTYLAAMRALDKRMASSLEVLPRSGKSAKSIMDAIAVYNSAVSDLSDVAASVSEEYPVLTVALNAVVEACQKHSKVFLKAIR